jgi:hypothetical protein
MDDQARVTQGFRVSFVSLSCEAGYGFKGRKKGKKEEEILLFQQASRS